MSECVRCERPVQDAHVCSICGHDAEKALGNVPWLSQQLDLTITRQTRFGPQNEGRGAQTPVVFNIRAGEARDVLRNILVGWTKLYVEEATADMPGDTLTAMSAFLLRRAEWFRHHELAAEFVGEVVGAVIDAQRTVDSPANRTTFAVGPCPEVDEEGVACPGEVRAFIPNDPSVMASMSCAACGAKWEPWQWHRAGRRIIARRDARMGA